MPLYEYRCESCEQVIEVLQKFSDEPLSECRTCGGRLERLLSPPGLQFKGTGWYITDYARAGQKSGDGKTEGSEKSTNGKPEKAKAEVKAESKTAD